MEVHLIVILISYITASLWLNPIFSQTNASNNTATLNATYSPNHSGLDAISSTIFLYPNIITAVGAVAGAVAGTYLAGKNVRDLELQKINKQEQEEREINIRLRRAILGELMHRSEMMDNLIKYSDSDTFAEASIILKSESDYLSLPLQKRAAIYDADELDLVESGYKTFQSFSALYDIHYRRFMNEEIGADLFKSILNIPIYKSLVDKAVERLKKDTKPHTPSTLQQKEEKDDKQEKNSNKKNGIKNQEGKEGQ